MNCRTVLHALALVPIASLILVAPAAAQLSGGPGAAHFPTSIGPDRHDTSAPLREMPEVEPRAPVFQEIPRQPLPRRGPKPSAVDPVRQGATGSQAMPGTTNNFDGVTNVNGVLPPDTNGAVGPNHYVQWVNLSFAIWNKSGALLYGPVPGNTLWNGFGGPCATSNSGDPIVLYDQLADRWFMSQFALSNYPSGPFYQCIAVSTTGDPTGSWNRYQFTVSNSKLNDYPKFSVWPDGYYMTVNQFTCNFIGCSWAGAGVAAFERAQMLAGQSARMVFYDLYAVDPNLGGMLPATLDGPAPPVGTRAVFAQMDDDAWGYSPDQLQIWTFGVDWTQSPPASSFTKEIALPTAAFDSNMCGYIRNCIPQPGTSVKVDALSDRLMYRLQYRTLGTDGAMVVNHTVDVDGTDKAGIRWYELRKPQGGSWGIRQQGTYAPVDADHRWMGSTAMDKDGNMALGFSASSGVTYPSIRYTGRLAGDALGTMTQGETTLYPGAGSQTHSSGRWGDYSALALDPDGCTFWYTQEYYASTSSASWRTRIGSFKFASCGGTPPPQTDLAITKSASPSPATAGSDLTYTLGVTNTGSDAPGVSVTDALPSGTTFKSVATTLGTCTGGPTVSCNLGTMTNGGSATITIVVTPTVAGSTTNSASVTGSVSDSNTANNTATSVTTVNPSSTALSVTSCSPNTGKQGQQLIVHVLGTSFQSGATVDFGTKINVQGVTFVNAGDLAVTIKVNPTATGSRTVTVTNPNRSSASKAGCFQVQ